MHCSVRAVVLIVCPAAYTITYIYDFKNQLCDHFAAQIVSALNMCGTEERIWPDNHLLRIITVETAPWWTPCCTFTCSHAFSFQKGQQENAREEQNIWKIGQRCWVSIALLCPPVAQRLSADEQHFIITTFRLLIFYHRGVGCVFVLGGRDTDRRHICTPGSDFYRHFHGILKICPAFAVVIVGCGRFFIHCCIMDVFALVSRFQLMDDSCGIHSLHHLQKLHLFFFFPLQGL